MPGSGLVKLFYLFAVNILISNVLITASRIKVYFANTPFTHIAKYVDPGKKTEVT